MNKLISILLTICSLFLLTSCKNALNDSKTPFSYETVYCTDVQASTEIAVVDGKLYCKWLDVQYDESGIRYDEERIDVIENIAVSQEWKRVFTQREIEIATPYFDKMYTYPLYEKIGRFAVLTDEHNDFYLLDTETGTQMDLQLNLEDWRAFATDNVNCFAVLSAYAVLIDREFKQEIRIYTLDQN